MKKIQIITNRNDQRTKLLKRWLKQNKVKYEEWSIHDSKVREILLNSSEFTKNYCEVDDCIIDLPAIHVEETDKYYFVDVIDFDSFYKLRKLLEIE